MYRMRKRNAINTQKKTKKKVDSNIHNNEMRKVDI